MSDPDLDELAAELSEFAAPEAMGGRPPREERVIAGFEEIRGYSSFQCHITSDTEVSSNEARTVQKLVSGSAQRAKTR